MGCADVGAHAQKRESMKPVWINSWRCRCGKKRKLQLLRNRVFFPYRFWVENRHFFFRVEAGCSGDGVGGGPNEVPQIPTLWSLAAASTITHSDSAL